MGWGLEVACYAGLGVGCLTAQWTGDIVWYIENLGGKLKGAKGCSPSSGVSRFGLAVRR